MAVIEQLIQKEDDGTLSFGNFTLEKKSKISDFEYEGDLYKVKTFYEITKLERNGLFIYESVPGTAVSHMKLSDEGLRFTVEGKEDAQITLELEPEKEYSVTIDGRDSGIMKTNLGGKLNLSVELNLNEPVQIAVVQK